MKELVARLRRGIARSRSGGGLEHTLLEGAVGTLAANLLGAGLAVALQVYLARQLGVEEFGVYTWVYNLLLLLALLGILGIDTALVRFVAQYRVQAEWGRLAGLLAWGRRTVLGASGLVALGLGLTGLVWAERWGPALAATMVAGAVVLPLLALTGWQEGALKGFRRVLPAQLPDQLIRPLALLGLVAGLVAVAGRPLLAWETMLATIAATAVGAAYGAWALARARRAEAQPAAPEVFAREWMAVSFPLLLVSGMRFLLQQTDVLVVGAVLGTREAGIYAVATRLTRLVALGLLAVNAISAPLTAELFAAGDKGGLERMTLTAAWLSTAACVPAALALVWLREPVLRFFGPEFLAGAGVLVLLALAQVVNAMTGPVGWLLNMTGHHQVNARILVWVAGANALLSWPATSWLGLEGAAVVTAVLVVVKNLWSWWEVKARLGIDGSVLATWARSRPTRGGGG